MKLQQTEADPPDDAEIRAILMGMTTGFTPTNTVSGGHMLSAVLEKPEALDQALKAAKEDRDADLWRILLEAMRFRPLNFGPFRYCSRDYTLASGRKIPAGATVLASTLSAMRDPRRLPNPSQFDATRSPDQYMLFGHGIHACYGAMIAEAHITQTLKALFKRPGFRAAPGADGKLQRVGPIPHRLMAEFDISFSKAAGQSMITICAPLEDASLAGAIEEDIKRLGNPAGPEARKAFEAAGCIHFSSLSVIRGGNGEPTYAVLEMSVDGKQENAIEALAFSAGPLLRPIFEKGCGLRPDERLAGFLSRHAVDVGYREKTAGLLFCGTPGLSVQRIKAEEALSAKLSQVLEAKLSRHRDGEALRLLGDVRDELRRDGGYDWAFLSEPAPFLANPNKPIQIPKIFVTLRLAGAAAGLVAATALLIWLAFSGGTHHSVAVNLFALLASLLLGAELALFLLGGLIAGLIFALRRHERADSPHDLDPDPAAVQAIMANENKHIQNHMTAVSVMKPGLLRNFTLRFMYFYVTRRLALFFRPGYLNEIGTIHFARWVLLPKTRNLVFFSNYAGSWESYMEDFITKAAPGLTGVWSNTIGFPATRHLLLGGAGDGDRFKRWARRQQIPTLFWFPAYPDLACERIRVNAAIRDGFARARTESEAAAWRSLFGSQPRPPRLLEDHEVQAIVFSGLGKLPECECLIVRLPGNNVPGARAWLSDYFSATRPADAHITFGDVMPTDRAAILAFTASGLGKLGLHAGETSVLNSFPTAFTHGMAVPWRSRVLGDEGPNAPENWLWGGPGNPADAAIILYASDKDKLEAARALELANLERTGGSLVYRVEMKLTLPPGTSDVPQDLRAAVPYFRETPTIEPFGFADGISQPLIKGTRKWYEDQNELHGVEAGEMILGYPDNRGYFPPTPQVTAKQDARDDLPLTPSQLPARWPQFGSGSAQAPRDLGRNGSFLVIRQLEQHVDAFNSYLETAAAKLKDEWPDIDVTADWLAAKMIGRWKNGTSLVRNPGRTGRLEIDNDFLLGQDDPEGLKCPFGAHIRRANPRDSLKPGDKDQIAISNRHRIFRVGRPYVETGPGGQTQPRGLLFMCVNADIERQFEFIQQTWIASPYFHGLGRENDPVIAPIRHDSTFTIPTHRGPLILRNMQTFITARGGGYFFLPGRSALRFLSRPR
ncbi:MAG: cytochrome P450 [Rhodomicrobium sp.]|nr:cytochrome P450 [Rhodomicrobium sp.]